ncbi:MAG: sensor histidine kinase [Stenotrophomonas maltophilia]
MVTLNFGPSEVLLRVTDDGIGFDPAAVHGVPSATGRGFGLSGMRERAGLVGGFLVLRSASGMGTTIEACIPYQTRSGSGITAYIEEASMAIPVR